LLEAGHLKVQMVADRVGYSSQAAFSDRFRQYFGYSPRNYRQIGKLFSYLGKDEIRG